MLVGASFMGALFVNLRNLCNLWFASILGHPQGVGLHVFVQEYYSSACVYIYRYVCLEKGWGGLYLCIGERNFLIVLNSR